MQGNGPKSPYTNVPGWHSHPESEALVKYARRLPSSATIVELGGEFGKSASEFLFATNGTGTAVHTVDLFPNDHPLVGNLKHAFMENISAVMEQLQVPFGENMSRIHVGSTDDVALGWDEPIDLLFIDAGHGYHQVVRDIENWAPSVAMGGYILFHDYAAHQGAHFLHHEVKKAVDRWWSGDDPFEFPAMDEFDFVEQVDSLRIYQRKVHVPLLDGEDEADLPLTDIKGVGKARAAQLVEAGITSVQMLADYDTQELVDIVGNISLKQAAQLQEDAKILLEA